MKLKNWRRLDVFARLDRNERAFMRTYDRLAKTAGHVHQIGVATMALQKNIVIMHERLQAVEQKTGITPPDPLIVKNERMQA